MMGNPEATEEEMMQAAKDAVCHNFIMRLPKGYDTVIDKETKLSGVKNRESHWQGRF